ncbi:Uncharacterized protein Fot_20928 [Forsythia ovata]|uniref:Uncharacterized protein n=1 Tax=Forsythia ovata TaxID=205694 RepID=A0ABD1UTD5_9LAMI
MGKPSRKFEKKIDDLLEKLQSGGGWPLLVVADVCGGKWRRGEPVVAAATVVATAWRWLDAGGDSRKHLRPDVCDAGGGGVVVSQIRVVSQIGASGGGGRYVRKEVEEGSCSRGGGGGDTRRGWWWPETPSAMEFAGIEGESWMGLWKRVWKLGIVNVTWTNPCGGFFYSHHATSTVGVIKFAHCRQENGADVFRYLISELSFICLSVYIGTELVGRV